MEIGLIHKVDIDREMQQSYLDYAMSVIVARALPDARDGLKPVHRRILYAMHDMNLRPEAAYKKSARIVGEVLGKYHPHGDEAVYEAMARMAQEFSMRYPLIDGQGNFGSQDGDPPAAMRYTEARLAPAAMHMLADIEKDTVNFIENFDGSLLEPDVLPAALPNLLINGATGIAVGMATSIPPHNLGEVVSALQYMLQNWKDIEEISTEKIMDFIQGPDFPTGGVILQEAESEGLISAYSTGRGRITLQARAHLEEMERGKSRIIVTELPYMVNKASLIERIAELVREERLEGVVDLRDESDRQGMRMVIEISKNADPEAVLRELYAKTPMQSTFSIIMLALVAGEPRLLSLKQVLRVYLEHRIEVVRRRSQFELEKARQRAHILEGLLIALKHLDEVIQIIRRAADADSARTRLMRTYKITQTQAQAILDMPLKRLAALERKKIEQEYKDTTAQIKTLTALLKSPQKMRQVVSEELEQVKQAYGDRRRTLIVRLTKKQTRSLPLTTGELMPEKTVWVALSKSGLIWRTLENKLPKIGAKDAPYHLVHARTKDVLYLVSSSGKAAAIPVHALPETDDPSRGVPFHQICPLSEEEEPACLLSLVEAPRRGKDATQTTDFLLTATREGMLKKSELRELPGPSASVFTLVKVNPGDQLKWLKVTNGAQDILLVTAKGMAIRFKESEVRPMGLVAAGVMGIKLRPGDHLAGMDTLAKDEEILLISNHGYAKRVPENQMPLQGRYGLGVVLWKLPIGEEVMAMSVGASPYRKIIHLKRAAPKMLRFDEVPLQSRAARGKRIFDLKHQDQITGMTFLWETPKASPMKSGSQTNQAAK